MLDDEARESSTFVKSRYCSIHRQASSRLPSSDPACAGFSSSTPFSQEPDHQNHAVHHLQHYIDEQTARGFHGLTVLASAPAERSLAVERVVHWLCDVLA